MRPAYVARLKAGMSAVICTRRDDGSGYTYARGTVVRVVFNSSIEIRLWESGDMTSFGVPKGRSVFARNKPNGELAAVVNAYDSKVKYDATYVPSFS